VCFTLPNYVPALTDEPKLSLLIEDRNPNFGPEVHWENLT